jgi:hypothetical protein
MADARTHDTESSDLPSQLNADTVPFAAYIEKLSQQKHGNNIVYHDMLDLLDKSKKSKISILRQAYGLSEEQAVEADRILCAMFRDASLYREDIKLPEKPIREYRPRESIIDYLQSPEGFGPWLEAKALTRPLLKRLSPKAYMALANWLRNNRQLPVGMSIPTKAEITEQNFANGTGDAALKAGIALFQRRRHADKNNDLR